MSGKLRRAEEALGNLCGEWEMELTNHGPGWGFGHCEGPAKVKDSERWSSLCSVVRFQWGEGMARLSSSFCQLHRRALQLGEAQGWPLTSRLEGEDVKRALESLGLGSGGLKQIGEREEGMEERREGQRVGFGFESLEQPGYQAQGVAWACFVHCWDEVLGDEGDRELRR